MENNGSGKLTRTTSMESEPKTLSKEQYDLARAAAAMHALIEQRNNEATGISRPDRGITDLKLDEGSRRY